MPNAVQASEAQPGPTINFEVQYIKNDSDKTVVGQPHKALIPIGFSEKETVKLPIVPGFTATSSFPESIERFTLEENSYTLDFSKFTKDTTIQIIYEPNGVNYMVQHLFQNLEQNGYVINPEMTETKPAKVGDTVTAEAREVDGQEFVFDKKTIPAKNLSVKAVWVEGEQTPYRIGYYVQNADGNSYTPIAFVTKQGKTGDPVVLPSEADQDPLSIP